MDFLNTFYAHIDAFLIYFFRMPQIPILGYLLGISILALYCVVLGQITIAVAYLANRKWIESNNNAMVHFQNLSIKALLFKSKPAYKACNKEANDAFGKVFFMQIALAAASLWPVPFALGWLQTRFLDVAFVLPFSLPYIGSAVGYTFTFIPMFILVYILFGKIKGQLPFFSRVEKILNASSRSGEQMITLADVGPPSLDS